MVSCDAPLVVAFRDALGKPGWVEGRNLVLDARGAGGKVDQLPSLAREIVAAKPDLIVASTQQPAQAAKAAARQRADVLYVPGDPMFHTPSDRVPALANRAGLPSVFVSRDAVEAGGLMSYGPDFMDMFRRAAGHADRILRGASAADLPVEQPTKYLLVINLKTAKAIGLNVPRSMLLRADEIIQ